MIRSLAIGLSMLLVLLTAVLAPVLSPQPPTVQDLARSQLPPAWLEGGSWENPLKPFTSRSSARTAAAVRSAAAWPASRRRSPK